jgi:2-oxopent-4-enoate hydratase
MSSLQPLADALWNAQQTRTPVPPLTVARPGLTVEEAYQIQSINIARRQADGGALNGGRALRVGHKVGLTSRAVQQQLGVNQPDFGVLLDDMVVETGGTANLGYLLQARAEGEVAFVLRRNLSGPGVTVAEVLAATEMLLPAIEIIDSRIADWKISYADTIADNASSGLFVLGADGVRPTERRLELMGMALRLNGEVVSTGAGLACMGHPANAVAWLANTLGRAGARLNAGDVILSGALGPVTPVRSGDRVDVDLSAMGSVSCRFEVLP